jgi:hypothetical protein
MCDNFLYDFKGAPAARHRPGLQPGRTAEGREVAERESVNWDGAAPLGRWRRRGKAGDCPLPGRRLSRGLSRAGALPSPRRRRRAAVPATARPGGDPPLRFTRHHTMRTRRGRRCGSTRDQPGNIAACADGLLPSNRRNDYPGGDSGPVKGAPCGRVAEAMAQAPPLTGPGRESPGPHSACRVEGRSGRSPPAPNRKDGTEC